MEELLKRSALESAALVREREISSTELVAFHLRRIEQLDPRVQAFSQVIGARALRRAAVIDRQRATRGDSRPLFLGVPTGIKDLEAIRGTFLRAGSRAYRWVFTPVDGPETRRIRRAGFVLLGKLTTSELALMPVVETDLQPSTRNPWNLDRTAGGSSGGSAAAVAAGLLPIAHASDGAGSIRIPSAFCHLFGFKPSQGLLPHHYERFEPLGLAVSGSVAHTVEDSIAMLDVLAGRWQYPSPPGSLLVQSRAPAPRGLRIKVCTSSPNTAVDPTIRSAVERFASWLEGQGHHVEAADGPDIGVDAFLPVFQRQATLAPVLRESALQPVTRWLREAGRSVTAERAQEIKDALARRILAWIGDADIVLSPTVGFVPLEVDVTRRLAPAEAFARLAPFGAFTAACNVTGQPAASIPAGVTDEGLPYAVQVAGRHGEDLALLRLCRELEQAMPWRHRRAAVAELATASRGSLSTHRS